MNTMNRRDLFVALSSLAALAAASAEGQGQEPGGPGSLPEVMAVPAPPGSAGDPVLSVSTAFRFEDLPVVKTANGETRAVTRGVLPGGEAVEMHETTLLPGHMPHLPHQHKHSEIMLRSEAGDRRDAGGDPGRAAGRRGGGDARDDAAAGAYAASATPAQALGVHAGARGADGVREQRQAGAGGSGRGDVCGVEHAAWVEECRDDDGELFCDCDWAGHVGFSG